MAAQGIGVLRKFNGDPPIKLSINPSLISNRGKKF